MDPLDLPGPRLHGCELEAVSPSHNIISFVRWCQFPHRTHEQISAVLSKVFALRHLSYYESDKQWLYVVAFPPMLLFDNYSMTVIPCKIHPCRQCQKRQGGITFTYLGPWTPPSIMTGMNDLLPPLYVHPAKRWQQSVLAMEPWIFKTDGDVRSFDLIDPDLRAPLHEDVILVDHDEDLSSLTEPESVEYLSSLTEDDIVEV